MTRRLETSILVYVPAIILSLMTLWLIDSWIRVPLFLIQVLVTVLVFGIVRSADISLQKRLYPCYSLEAIKSSHLLLLGAVVLFFWDFFPSTNTVGSALRTLIAFLMAGLAIGSVMLTHLQAKRHLSRLESLLLSFLLSYVIIGGLTLILSPIVMWLRSKIFLGILIGFGIIATYRDRKEHERPFEPSRPKSLSRPIDLFVLVLAVILYGFFYLFVNPNYAILAGTDNSRHYMNALLFNRSPDLYLQHGLASYFLFHLFNAGVYSIAGGPSVAIFQSTPLIFNLLLPVAIYCLAKRYIGKYDARLSALVVLFWVFLNNLAFIPYLISRITYPDTHESLLILQTALRTYWGTVYPPQPYGWFSPQSLCFLFFFSALLLVRLETLGRKQLVGLYAVTVFGLYASHIVEAIIFCVILCGTALFFRKGGYRLEEALQGGIMGMLGGIVMLWGVSLNYSGTSPILPALLVGVVACLSLVGTFLVRKKLLNKVKPVQVQISGKLLGVIALGLIVVFFVSFIVFKTTSFDFRDNYALGIVPWFLYPMLLGLTALLAIFALPLFRTREKQRFLLFFAVIVILLFLLGEVISFINTRIFTTNYWERRFPPFIFMCCALIAPLGLLHVTRRYQARDLKHERRNKVLVGALAGLIVLFGYSSTPVQMEYWYIYSNNSTDILEPTELEALDFLADVLDGDPSAYVTSITLSSYDRLAFAGPPYRVIRFDLFSESTNPDLPYLLASRYPALSHLYIYLHHRDFGLAAQRPQSYFWRHLLRNIPVVFQNQDVMILNLSRVTVPVNNAPTRLILPYNTSIDPAQDWTYIYDLFSKAAIPFTSILDPDPGAIQGNMLVLSYDPLENASSPLNRPPNDFVDAVREGATLVVFNPNANGIFSQRYLSLGNDARSVIATHIQGGYNMSIPSPLNITSVPSREEFITIASYNDEAGTCLPYALQETLGAGRIIFCNIRPLIQILDQNYHRYLFDVLGKLILPLNLSFDQVPAILPYARGFVDDIVANGIINITAGAMFIDPTRMLQEVGIQTQAGNITYSNVKRFSISRTSQVQIQSASLVLQRAWSLYSRSGFFHPLRLQFGGYGANIALEDDAGQIRIHPNITSVYLNDPQYLEIYTRDAHYSIAGNTSLTGFHFENAFYGDLNLQGVLTFKPYVGEHQLSLLSMNLEQTNFLAKQ